MYPDTSNWMPVLLLAAADDRSDWMPVLLVAAVSALLLVAIIGFGSIARRLSGFWRGCSMVVMWVLVFMLAFPLGVALFPFESVCNPPGTSLTDDINCQVRWAFGLLLLGVGLATAVVIIFSLRTRPQQSSESQDLPHLPHA